MKLKNEAKFLQQFWKSLMTESKIDGVSKKFLSLFKEVFNYHGYAVLILNEETNQFDFSYTYQLSKNNLDEVTNLIEEGVIDWALKESKPILIPTFTKIGLSNGPSKNNFLIIPLAVSDRRIGAIISLCYVEEKSVNQQILDLLTFLASQVSIVVENLKLNSKMQHKKEELSILLKSSMIVSSSLELNKIMESILKLALKEVKSEYGVLSLLDRQTKKLIPQVSSGISLSMIAMTKENSDVLNKGALEWVVKNNKPLIIDDYPKDARFQNSKEFINLHLQTLLVVPLSIAGQVIGVLALCNCLNKPFYTKNDLDIAFGLANYVAIAIKNRFLYEDLQHSFLDTVKALIKAIEAKDPYTKGHSEGVTKYSLQIAQALNLSEKEIEMIKFCGLLHDIGKIGIRDSILSKPSKLTRGEYEITKKHPIIGENMVKHIKFLQPGLCLVRHHHERYDGTGYPDGLKGKDIPLLARIGAIADAFDAMVSDRPYRRALPLQEALKELKEGAGTQFDPEIVRVFLSTLKLSSIFADNKK
ncbi:GAF domain-containing protein [Candidatus Aerophobetes bacterium]|nr:GAF domain-containing protein [Candidatus Aerophobetes bacterium]